MRRTQGPRPSEQAGQFGFMADGGGFGCVEGLSLVSSGWFGGCSCRRRRACCWKKEEKRSMGFRWFICCRMGFFLVSILMMDEVSKDKKRS